MKIIAKVGQYDKGTNKEIGQKFVDNIEKYFRKEFPNGYFEGGLRNSIGTDHIAIRFGLGGWDVTPQNDKMFHSIIIQWGDNFGNQKQTLEENPDLTFSVSSSGLSINPEKDSYMAMGRVKTKLTNVKKGGTLDKFDAKMKKWFPQLKKLYKENKDNLYRVQDLDAQYLP